MAFHENKHISFFILLAYIVLAFFAAKLFFSVVFPWTIPLIISVIMSAVIEKPVKHLEKRKVPRKIASAVCTLLPDAFRNAVLFYSVGDGLSGENTGA